MEKCPFCDEDLDLISIKLKSLEIQNQLLKAKLEEKEKSQIVFIHKEEHFVASSNRGTFHRLECQWAEYILSSDNLIEFHSHEEAVEAGYKPCKTCRA